MRYQVRGRIIIEVEGWVEAESEAFARQIIQQELLDTIPEEIYPGEIDCGGEDIATLSLDFIGDEGLVLAVAEVATDSEDAIDGP